MPNHYKLTPWYEIYKYSEKISKYQMKFSTNIPQLFQLKICLKNQEYKSLDSSEGNPVSSFVKNFETIQVSS